MTRPVFYHCATAAGQVLPSIINLLPKDRELKILTEKALLREKDKKV